MDFERVQHAQGFLQIESVEGRKRILDIEALLSYHAPEAVVSLLDDLIRENKTKLRRLLRKRDKSNPKIDILTSRIFRLSMSRIPRLLFSSVATIPPTPRDLEWVLSGIMFLSPMENPVFK